MQQNNAKPSLSELFESYPYDQAKHGTKEAYYFEISKLTEGRVTAGGVGAEYRKRRHWESAKKMIKGDGTIIHEVLRAVPQDHVEDLSGYEATKLTSNPYGGQWVKYEKKELDPIAEIKLALDGITFKKAEKYKPTRSKRALKVTLSDVHVGMRVSTDSLFSYAYGKKEFEDSLDFVYSSVMDKYLSNGKFDVLIIQDLGDGLDGYNNQTTRGGHSLDQNMSNNEMFRTFVTGKLGLIDRLYRANIANRVEVKDSVNCNHAGDFGYMANYAIKLACEKMYPSLQYDIFERFIDHFIYGEHCFIQTHGKDKKYMAKGMPLKLDDKTEKMINQYIDRYNITSKYIHFEKGDLHQISYDKRKKFDYRNFMSFAPPSNWVQHNCGDGYWGFSLQVIDPQKRTIEHSDLTIDYEE